MSHQPRVRNEQESAPELVYNIDQLEDLVSNAKRVPMSHKVMVDEDEFVQILEEIRTTIPMEIRDAQHLLKERERVIGEAHEEAERIVSAAKRHAAVLVSDHTVLEEAKQHAEELLRIAEQERQEARGRMEVFFMQQIKAVRSATLATMSSMEATAVKAMSELERAEEALGVDPDATNF